MKRSVGFFLILSLSFLTSLSGQTAAVENPEPASDSMVASSAEEDYNITAIVSYAFGVSVGTSLKNTMVEIDFEIFSDAIQAVLEGSDLMLSNADANMIIQMALQEAMSRLAAVNAAAEESFLLTNSQRPTVITTSSGLQYEILEEGQGLKPTLDDCVTVDYVGSFIDGTVFDSSAWRGEPTVLDLARVIPGWSEGVQLMAIGSKYKLYIPSELAYGEYGAGEDIGPYQTLIFEVELLSVEPSLEL